LIPDIADPAWDDPDEPSTSGSSLSLDSNQVCPSTSNSGSPPPNILDFDHAAVPEPTHHEQDDRDDLGDAEDPLDHADPGSLGDPERESDSDGGPDEYPIGPHTFAVPNQYDEDEVQSAYRRDEITIAEEYIKLIKNARLGDQYDKLDEATRERLANPPEEPVSLDNPDLRFSLGLYMAMQNASEDTYLNVRRNILHRYPDSGVPSIKSSVAWLKSLESLPLFTICALIRAWGTLVLGQISTHARCAKNLDGILSKASRTSKCLVSSLPPFRSAHKYKLSSELLRVLNP
jgi:hypothetical protein